MNIFSACLNTETNTFSPLPMGMNDFSLTYHKDYIVNPESIRGKGPVSVWNQLCEEGGHHHHMGLLAFAEPSGIALKNTYESLRNEILNRLTSTPEVDIVLLDLHGAMVADGYLDCEGDLIEKIRQIVGDTVVIGVELDLHGHITQRMLSYADIIMGYKEYPHTDINERAAELFQLAVDTKLKKIKPTMAIFDCKMVSIFPTTSTVMRSFVDKMQEEEDSDCVLSMSLMHGFPWGDTPDSGVKMLAITNNDYDLATALANLWGLKLFSLRDEISFDSKPINDALTEANSSNNYPVVVADQSDNPGGGAPSDSTFALKWLLDNKVESALLAFIYDPEVVKIAKLVGIGGNVQVRVGGKMSIHSGQPVDAMVKVIGLSENYMHTFFQENDANVLYDIGDVAVLRVQGIDLVLSSKRSQCFSPDFMTHFNLNPTDYKIIIPKSTQHFFTAFSQISNEIIYMSAKGAITPNVKLIPYEVMSTKDKYPWCQHPHRF